MAGCPDGGWTPPDSEIERREAVERDKEAKRLAEIERSRTFTLGTIAPLDEALLARVRAKALDPDQRTPMARADRDTSSSDRRPRSVTSWSRRASFCAAVASTSRTVPTRSARRPPVGNLGA